MPDVVDQQGVRGGELWPAQTVDFLGDKATVGRFEISIDLPGDIPVDLGIQDAGLDLGVVMHAVDHHGEGVTGRSLHDFQKLNLIEEYYSSEIIFKYVVF